MSTQQALNLKERGLKMKIKYGGGRMDIQHMLNPQSRQCWRSTGRGRLQLIALCGAILLATLPALAQQPATTPAAREPQATPMPTNEPPAAGANAQTSTKADSMEMRSMQGGTAPPAPRDPDYSDGYKYTGMRGFEKSDQIAFGKLLVDELEFLSGNEGEGVAWSVQGMYGGDFNKFWLRTQGLWIRGQQVDPTTTVEALWWRAVSPFWGTLLGARQDIGPGAHTWLAFGVEGLAPYWFEFQLTGYVGEDGRLSARLKASYDVLFTNRLILTPQLESNVYSRAEPDRGLGKGVGNLEVGLRLRYEFSRKLAPYIGYVWERSFAETADLQRAKGDPVTERRFVAGIRLWW